MLDRTKKLQGDLGSSYHAAFDPFLESVRERPGSWKQEAYVQELYDGQTGELLAKTVVEAPRATIWC
jgi:hypothetical protein